MKKYLFTNIIGTFVFNEHYKLIDSIMFRNIDDYSNKDKFESQLNKKHKAIKPENKTLIKIQEHFKPNLKDFYKQNLELTKQLIKQSVNDDNLIIQTISSIDDLKKVANTLAKRLREWYALYNPELEHETEDHEFFIKSIFKDQKDSIMGANLKKQDLEPISNLAEQLEDIFNLIKTQEDYLDKVMRRQCPNITSITGSKIGAKLLEQAGSLKRLMEFPSSTIQLLGAEKALFRHIKTKAKSPKYGFLHDHPLVNKVAFKDKGKVARALADKLSIAAKVDYFKGKFVGDELRKKLEAKFKNK